MSSSSASLMYAEYPLRRDVLTIRLWRFTRSSTSEHMQLEMKASAENEGQRYVALSYMWGSYENAKLIHVGPHALKITEKLWDFLVVLSEDSGSSGRWFWCDQISINQLDVQERNHQVSLMSSIYTNAETVFAYIGPEPPEDILDERAFDLIFIWRMEHAASINIVLTWMDIFYREYWSRLWIVQELRCANQGTIWCGRHSIRKDDLYRNLVVLSEESAEHFKRHRTYETFLNIKHIKEFNVERSRMLKMLLAPRAKLASSNLWGVLGSFSGNACQDPRDRVYGLQSLVLTEDRIPIDYSITFEQLLYKIVRDLVAPGTAPQAALQATSTEGDDSHAHAVSVVARLAEYQTAFTLDIQAVSWGYSLYYQAITGKGFNGRWGAGFTPKQKALLKAREEQFELFEVDMQDEFGLFDLYLQPTANTHEEDNRRLAEILTRHGFVLFDTFLYHPDEWPFSKGIATEWPIHADFDFEKPS